MELCQARTRYLRWLETTRDLSPHTLRAYDSDIAALERFVGEEVNVAEIDRECLLSFVDDLRAAGLASLSIRRRASGLRGFHAWLRTSELVAVDPWTTIALDLRRSRKLPRPLSATDLDALLSSLRDAAGIGYDPIDADELEHPNEATTLLAVALMVATGLRVSEAVGTRCRDIDLRGRSMRVMGKGRRERQVFLPNEWIAHLVDAYLTTRAALDVRHDRLLFNHRRQPLTVPALRTRLLAAGNAAGLSHRLTPHMLRHTAATQLIEAGVDIRFVQRLLGHASLSTTELYTHVSDHALKRVVSDADVLGRSFIRDN
jgi:site-specific recombinase XerD